MAKAFRTSLPTLDALNDFSTNILLPPLIFPEPVWQPARDFESALSSSILEELKVKWRWRFGGVLEKKEIKSLEIGG